MCFMAVLLGVWAPFEKYELETRRKTTVKSSVSIAHKASLCVSSHVLVTKNHVWAGQKWLEMKATL